MSRQQPIEATKIIEDANCGILHSQLSAALRDVSHGVIDHSKVGKVTLTLTLKQVGEGHQINMTHKVDYKCPTKYGTRSEDTASNTVYYVGPRGMTLMPDAQTDMFDIDEETGEIQHAE